MSESPFRIALPVFRERALYPTLAMVTAIAATAVLCCLLPTRGMEPAAETVSPPEPSAAGLRLTGVASCSAQACHGDVRRDDAFPEIWGNEHTVWVQDDPHAKAYLMLYGQRSLDMAQRLGLGKPYLAQECLTCHAPAGRTNTATAAFEPSDAVGCESCHGPAERWLAQHTERDWRRKTPEQKAALGMRHTKDPAVRAQLCAGCHVGGSQQTGGRRDVNHDLIAAGHPRLQFELTAYLSQLRRHWDEKADDPARPEFDPAFQTRLWAVGQAVSAHAAAELLVDRAANSTHPWPELSEFDCYACHHQLRGDGWRQSAAYLGPDGNPVRPGSLRWRTWHVAMLSPLEQIADVTRLPGPPMTAVSELRRLMETGVMSRDAVRDQAKSTAERLARWSLELNCATYPPAGPRDLMRSLLNVEQTTPPWNWDTAAQCYLAMRALASTRAAQSPTVRDEQITAKLKEIRGLLAFPIEPGVGRYDSPKDYDPAKVQERLNELRRLLDEE